MRKIKRTHLKCLSFLLALGMFSALGYVTAKKANAEVTPENADDIFGDGTASYDAEEYVLTLNDPVISGTHSYTYTDKITGLLETKTCNHCKQKG